MRHLSLFSRNKNTGLTYFVSNAFKPKEIEYIPKTQVNTT